MLFRSLVTNCSNNYGPYQFPEKLIPLFINNIRHRKPLPVYGRGENLSLIHICEGLGVPLPDPAHGVARFGVREQLSEDDAAADLGA